MRKFLTIKLKLETGDMVVFDSETPCFVSLKGTHEKRGESNWFELFPAEITATYTGTWELTVSVSDGCEVPRIYGVSIIRATKVPA